MFSKAPPKILKIPQNSKRKGSITFIVEYRDMKPDETDEVDKKIIGCVLGI